MLTCDIGKQRRVTRILLVGLAIALGTAIWTHVGFNATTVVLPFQRCSLT